MQTVRLLITKKKTDACPSQPKEKPWELCQTYVTAVSDPTTLGSVSRDAGQTHVTILHCASPVLFDGGHALEGHLQLQAPGCQLRQMPIP